MTEEISNVHYIKCVDKDELGYVYNAVPRPRLWYRPEDMEYFDTHFTFRRKVPRDTPDGKSFTIKNLQVIHDHNMRSKEREQKRLHYEYQELPKLEDNETTMIEKGKTKKPLPDT